MKTNNKDKMIEEFWTALRNHTMWRDSANGLIEDRITELLAEALTKHEEAVVERHAKEINRILNLHSKPIAEGGLDYVKAFEEMERYEKKLYKKALTPDNPTSDNK